MSNDDDDDEEEEQEQEEEDQYWDDDSGSLFRHDKKWAWNENEQEEEQEEEDVLQKLPAIYMNFEREAFAKNAKKQRKMPTRKPKQRIADIAPPGYGPWWVFMLVNVVSGEDTKKQTEVRLDTYPDLITVLKVKKKLVVLFFKIGRTTRPKATG